VYVCDQDVDGVRDATLQTTAPQFYQRCPNTNAAGTGDRPRKLIWMDARQQAPLYFLGLLGFNSVNLHTDSIAEAAAVDMVIVLDTSESMAIESLTSRCAAAGYPNVRNCPYSAYFNPNNNRPDGCNPAPNASLPGGDCEPMLSAKNAAKALVDRMYNGYDMVSLVTFNHGAYEKVRLTTQLNTVKTAIDNVRVHDDPAFMYLWPEWRVAGRANPVNPDDRDGNGVDADPDLPCTLDEDRWDTTRDPYGWGGVPCDDPNFAGDSFNMNLDDLNSDGQTQDEEQIWNAQDAAMITDWYNIDSTNEFGSLSLLSTCTGCGMRIASNELKLYGRPGSVWVVVFLSDGMVNLSDTPATLGDSSFLYKNGFCNQVMGQTVPISPSNFLPWNSMCQDAQPTVRFCIDDAKATCPPGTRWIGDGWSYKLYSVFDYALDMTDEAALTRRLNTTDPLEPRGNDIAIYSIGLGDVSTGETLLRYMAAVGDDGARTDPCTGHAARENCGQYYYASNGSSLLPIFENIASRIYTRIAQ
jgi:hypothetical protein